MAVDEAARLRLYEKARDTWGDEEALTLVTSLPRDPGELITRDYLDLRLSELEHRLRDSITGTLTTRFMTMLLAGNATLVGLVFAAVKLG